MEKDRLAAFSDGVLAIIITIMVLELKAPHSAEWSELLKLLPVFLSYVLSFIYIGIYWNNHHHLLQACTHVNGTILWANTHLLFWLSLIPFATAWMGENHFASQPSMLYGVSLLMPAIAYYILQLVLLRSEGKDSVLARALGRDFKGKISPFIYIAGVVIAYFNPVISNAIYVFAALMWLVPDRRIERIMGDVEGDVKG
jgi:uncharacterized membrane protein